MSKKIVILGAGGHGRVCADIAELCGYSEIVFLDDREIEGIAVAGDTREILRYVGGYDFFVGIGNNETRRIFMEKIELCGGKFATLIHPASTVARSAMICEGSAVMAGAVVGVDAVIGKGVVINTCASVDHDCIIGDYAHIAVGTHLSGTVHFGKSSFAAAGSTVINNIDVCADVVIGAGGVVIRNIVEPGIYVGSPAKRLEK